MAEQQGRRGGGRRRRRETCAKALPCSSGERRRKCCTLYVRRSLHRRAAKQLTRRRKRALGAAHAARANTPRALSTSDAQTNIHHRRAAGRATRARAAGLLNARYQRRKISNQHLPHTRALYLSPYLRVDVSLDSPFWSGLNAQRLRRRTLITPRAPPAHMA